MVWRRRGQCGLILSNLQNGRSPRRIRTQRIIPSIAYLRQRSTLPSVEVWTPSSTPLGRSARNLRWSSSVQRLFWVIGDCMPVWTQELADWNETWHTCRPYVVVSCE